MKNRIDTSGWSAYTTRGDTKADDLASYLYDAAKFHLPGQRLRTDYADGDPDLAADFYILRQIIPPSVLVENFFMDSRHDCHSLLSESGQQAIVNLHVDGIIRHLSTVTSYNS